jgi:nitroimidazol reductase NimA-like FMN-containing flavoprotein (pyridoxamine 5'-phosphate oxidase superfamily)
MSALPEVRRPDKVMDEDAARALLARGFAGRLGTADAAGQPYVMPLLYVWDGMQVWVHNTAARGHLRANVEANDRICFEVDEPGPVFAYGRFECDTGLAYESVVVFGRIRVVADRDAKQGFCEALMAKYSPSSADRPAGFFPRLGQITVYAIALDRITGKRTPLPGLNEQWPAKDRSATPDAVAPRRSSA